MKLRPSLLVAIAVVAILAGAIFLPAVFVKPEAATNLPWQVRANAQGGVDVFGVTVGQSTLLETERAFGAESEVTLFRSPKGSIVVEAYFDNVNLHGLSAKIVVGLRVPEEDLASMYDRGVQVAKLGSGTQKVTLASADRVRVDKAVINTLAYMPSIHLDEERVAKRFGEPAEKWKEPKSGVVHWLYPSVGLDVAMSKDEKEVLQYVPPAEFGRLRDPLIGGERLP